MAEYLIQGETLTELGDKIRVLSGTESTLTPSQMTSNVQSANDEVDAQSALIDQLSAALDGKAGGGSDNTSVETCTVTLRDLFIDMGMTEENYLRFVSATVMENEEIKAYSIYPEFTNDQIYEIIIPNVVCGTVITFVASLGYGNSPPYVEIDGTAEFVSAGRISEFYGDYVLVFKAPKITNEQCCIKYAYEP